jgi:hypothetical protein
MTDATRKVELMRMYTDESGETHFSDELVEVHEVNFAPPAPAMYASAPIPAAQTLFLLCPDGWYGDMHPAPRRQLMVLMYGELEVTVSDGTTRRFTPGQTTLVEDTTGKGHATRALRESLIAVTQL